MLRINLEAVETTEAIIINKLNIQEEKLVLSLSRRTKKAEKEDIYIGTCSAEMYLESEVSTDILKRSFYVKISLDGKFRCISSSPKIEDEELSDEIMRELLPHASARMASVMASAGLPPYLIPVSINAEFK